MLRNLFRLAVIAFSLSMITATAHPLPVTDGPLPPCLPCGGGGN